MTAEEDIVKELREHSRLLRAEIGLLSEIKFELQNSRKMSEATYKIRIRESWLDKIKRVFNF